MNKKQKSGINWLYLMYGEEFLADKPELLSEFIDFVQGVKMKKYKEEQKELTKLQKQVDKKWKKK